MAKPDVRVRIAFSDGPYVASPTWTNVTSYVRSINISRGRNDDWTNFDSGSATLVLDNRDRRFDPTYSAGPYYGNLQPRRQVWIDATTNGSTYYEIFRGFIDGWPVNITQAGYDSTVTISCYDVLGLISQEKLPYDWSDSYIRSLNPNRYWRLDDTINPADIPTTAGTLENLKLKDYGSENVPLSPKSVSIPTANRDPLAPGILSKGIMWATGNRYTTHPYDTALTYTTLAGGGSMWYIGQTTNLLWSENGVNGTDLIIVDADYDSATQQLRVRSYSYTTGRYDHTGTVNLTVGVPHHFAFRWTGAGSTSSVNAYVDGVEITLTKAFVAGTLFDYGRGYQFWNLAGQQLVAWRNSAPTAAQLRTIYQLGNNVLTETTAARMTRILNETPIPGAFYGTPASPAGTVAELTVGGAFVGNELQLTSDSEGGELFTARSGVLTMTNRTYFESGNSKTNQATFGVGGIPIGTEISYAWNADNIRNTLDIGWSGGANYTASDTSSVNTYGVMQDSWQTALSTLADVENLASYLVGFGKLPRLVMSAIEVGQAMSAAEWNTVLNLELLDRITVVVDEPVGSDLTQVQLIQQLEHEITPGDWRVRILGSSRWTSYFILDTSTLDGTDLLG